MLHSSLGLTVRSPGLGLGLEIIHLLRTYPVVGAALNAAHASSHLIPSEAALGRTAITFPSQRRKQKLMSSNFSKLRNGTPRCLSSDTLSFHPVAPYLGAGLALWR